MKINKQTTQAELETLYAALARQEFLKGTPLNLKFFLRYAILFLLFPGMIFGFWQGLCLTGAFCALLISFLATDNASWGVTATGIWLCLGGIPIILVSYGSYKQAKQTRIRRMQARAPQRPLTSSPAASPDHTPLHWRRHRKKHGSVLSATHLFQAPADGIYGFLLSLEEYSGSRLTTDGPDGVCVAHSGGKPGETFNALLLYRLQAGEHQLSWTLAGKSAPKATLTLLTS